MRITGNYCPACVNFFSDDDIGKDDLKELTILGSVVYCPNKCVNDYDSLTRQELMDSDELEISTPQMNEDFERKKDELIKLLTKANDLSQRMELLSYTYLHEKITIKDFNNYE